MDGESPVVQRRPSGSNLTADTTSGTNPSAIESARRFLYDEDDEPTPGASNTPLPPTNYDYDKKSSSGRLNPVAAACLATWTTLKNKSSLLCILIVAVIIIVIVVLTTSSSHGSSGHNNKRTKFLQAKIIQAGLSTKEQLDSKSHSLQQQALHWVALEDKTVNKKTFESENFLLEKYALVVLYLTNSKSHTNSGWTNDENWMNPSVGHCQWYGVECVPNAEGLTKYNGNGHVEKLLLPKNNFYYHEGGNKNDHKPGQGHGGGGLVPELAGLQYLVSLDLSQNDIPGTLPANWGVDMETLHDILLHENQLTGAIPKQWGEFPELRVLELGQNQLTGTIPETFRLLAMLKGLGLQKNQLTGNPPSMEGSQSLRSVYFDNNKFTGRFPGWLMELQGLVDIRLSNNQFTGKLPYSFEDLRKLEILHLNQNQFNGTLEASWFQSWNRMMELHLYENKFTGTIPTTMGLLSDLRSLLIGNNTFTGKVPQELELLLDVVRFDISYNEFKDTIPDLYAMKDVEIILMNNNQLTGTIPTSFGWLSRLRELRLDHNNLEGQVPSELGKLPRLTVLELHKNKITGSIPLEVCTLNDEKLKLLTADCAASGNSSVTCTCCSTCF